MIGNQEQIAAKLRELEAVGVDQFNIYLMTHAQEETLAAYGDGIIPELAGGRSSPTRPARSRSGSRPRVALGKIPMARPPAATVAWLP